MDEVIFQYMGRTFTTKVESATPKYIQKHFGLLSTEFFLLDADFNAYIPENDYLFSPRLTPQWTYDITNTNNFEQKQQQNLLSQKYYNSIQGEQHNLGTQFAPEIANANQIYPENLKNTTILNNAKAFFETITNGCVAVEYLVMLGACSSDIKIDKNISLRVLIYDAIQVFGNAYMAAENAMRKVILRFNEIPILIRQGLKANSIETVKNFVQISKNEFEEKLYVFDSPVFKFVQLEKHVKSAQKKEDARIEYEEEKINLKKIKLKRYADEIKQKKEMQKSMNTEIKSIAEKTESLKRNLAHSFWPCGSKKCNELEDEIQNLQKEKFSLRKTVLRLQREIEDLEESQLLIQHEIDTAKTDPSIKWTPLLASLIRVISQIKKIQESWKSVLTVFETVENDVHHFQILFTKDCVDNSMLTHFAAQISINTWAISQCCEIYADIVLSHVIPLISEVTTNFGLTEEEVMKNLMAEKTKAQMSKNEIETLTTKRISDALNLFPHVLLKYEKFFSTVV